MAFVGAFDAKTHLAELARSGWQGREDYDYEAWRSCGDAGPCRGNKRKNDAQGDCGRHAEAAQADQARQDERPSDGGRGAALLTGIVIDASVALAWCFPDEASEYADGGTGRVGRARDTGSGTVVG